MAIALFILYAAVLSYLLARSQFLLKSGLPAAVLIALFLLYSLAGCLHLGIAFHFFPNHGDLWRVFDYSIGVRHQLQYDYPAFIKEFFPDSFSIDLAGTHFGWSPDELQELAVLHLLFDFISWNNIYINTLLFCFLSMYGKTAFYRMLCDRYPGQQFTSLLLAFLLPGVLFWTAVIHKEGLLFCSLGMLLYCLQKLLAGKGGSGEVLMTVLMLVVIFITRKWLLVILIPALVVGGLSEKFPAQKKWVVPTAFFAFICLFIVMAYIHPSWSLLHRITEKQQQFLALKGGSALFLPVLDNSAASFAVALPYALLNGFFMPLPGFGGKMLYGLLSLELLIVWGCVGWSLYVKGIPRADGFQMFALVFALAGCLIIGYTVPFAGAIVRYRSILYPFLLAPFLFGLNKPPLFAALNRNLSVPGNKILNKF